LSRKNQNDFDDDLTRIEDLPPLEHPPLPKLPQNIPEFTLPKLPETLAAPPNFDSTAVHEIPTSFPEVPETPKLEEMAMEFEQVNFNQEPNLPSLNTPIFEETQNAPEIFETEMPEPTTQAKIKSVSEEIFEDVKEEMETFVLKHVAFESYPSYSLYISEIKTGRQRNSIKLLLKEYGLMQSDTEKELIQRSLQLKHLLIPRISEYAAIFFANKLEGLNVHIKLSPSEDLGSQHELWDKGPITQESFHHHQEVGDIVRPSVFISQNFSFADKSVRLLGIVLQQTIILDRSEVKENFHIYFNRLQELKEQAREVNANAILGLSFQQIDQEDVAKVLFLVTGEAAIVHEE
jgi:hypothetical protein